MLSFKTYTHEFRWFATAIPQNYDLSKMWKHPDSFLSHCIITIQGCMLSYSCIYYGTLNWSISPSRKTAILDVDNEKEYKDMVSKIQAEVLKKMTILIDMLDVQESCTIHVSNYIWGRLQKCINLDEIRGMSQETPVMMMQWLVAKTKLATIMER